MSLPRFVCRSFASLAVVFLFGMTGGRAAEPFLQLVQEVYPNLLPGGDFVLEFQVVNPNAIEIVGYDFSPSASSENAFFVVQQILVSPVNFPAYSGSFPFAIPLVDPEGGTDFGAISVDGTSGFGQGTSLAQTLTISIASEVAPGTYMLVFDGGLPELAGPGLFDVNGDYYFMSQPLIVTVTVVPEPQALGLVAAAGLLMGLIQGRRKWHLGDRVAGFGR